MRTVGVGNKFWGKSILQVVGATVFVLLIPLVAMQFTDEVDWGLSDFVVIGTLLLSAGLIYEWLACKTGNKLLVGLVVATVVILIWVELAVGIFGTPLAGN